MKHIHNISLRKLFSLILILLGSITILICTFSIVMTSRQSVNAHNLVFVIEGLENIIKLESNLLKHRYLSNLALISPDSTVLGQQEEIRRKLLKRAPGDELEQSNKELQLRQSLNLSIQTYLENSTIRKSDSTINDFLKRSSESFNNTLQIILKLSDLKLNQARQIENKAVREVESSYLTTFLVSLLVIFLVSLVLIFIRNYIYNPVLKLNKAIKSFNLTSTQTNTQIKGPAEIIEIDNSFRMMTKKIILQQEKQHQFLASVAHDLRNPLAGIQAASEILVQSSAGTDNDSQKFAGLINRQVKQLNLMVDDLLEILKSEGGKIELNKEKEDLREILDDSIRLYMLTTRKHQFNIDIPQQPVYCEVDSLRMSEVFNNIISNAIKYSPEGGNIYILLSGTPHEILIKISDEGVGIPDESLKDIFEPFMRTTEAASSFSGEGLGLFIAKRIIEAHNGSVKVESEQHEGTVFEIRIPYSSNGQQ